MNETPQIHESEFLPTNVLPLDTEARQVRKQRKYAMRPERALTKGGVQVMKVKVAIPIAEWSGLQRFEGEDDSERINMLIRMANRRVDQMVIEQQKAQSAPPETTA